MAAKKKAKKTSVKAKARKVVKKAKSVVRKAAKAVSRTAKNAAKAVRGKAAPRKAAKAATKRKASSRGEYGEGNYKASRRFRTKQETFVKKNKRKIGKMGKDAEKALDGPEGNDLMNAAAEAAAHAAGQS